MITVTLLGPSLCAKNRMSYPHSKTSSRWSAATSTSIFSPCRVTMAESSTAAPRVCSSPRRASSFACLARTPRLRMGALNGFYVHLTTSHAPCSPMPPCPMTIGLRPSPRPPSCSTGAHVALARTTPHSSSYMVFTLTTLPCASSAASATPTSPLPHRINSRHAPTLVCFLATRPTTKGTGVSTATPAG